MEDRYERALPLSWREGYRAARKARDGVALHNEAALLKTFIETALSKLETGETNEIKLRELADQWEWAPDEAKAEIVVEIIAEIRTGSSAWDAVRETSALIEQMRKVVATESRRRKDEETTFGQKQLQALADAVIDIIKRNVADKEVQHQICKELGTLLSPAHR